MTLEERIERAWLYVRGAETYRKRGLSPDYQEYSGLMLALDCLDDVSECLADRIHALYSMRQTEKSGTPASPEADYTSDPVVRYRLRMLQECQLVIHVAMQGKGLERTPSPDGEEQGV